MKPAITLEELVEAGWAPSVRFLQKRLRSGQITGKKSGRQWLMSDEDVQRYLDSISNRSDDPQPEPQRLGLTVASQRRRAS